MEVQEISLCDNHGVLPGVTLQQKVDDKIYNILIRGALFISTADNTSKSGEMRGDFLRDWIASLQALRMIVILSL